MPKKIPRKGNPEVHQDLSGFDIRVNEFGALESTIQIDKLNEFLNDKVVDKKLNKRSMSEQKGSGEEE